ncbi:hypothetical protein Tco_1137874 [Tanacetum coccineum]
MSGTHDEIPPPPPPPQETQQKQQVNKAQASEVAQKAKIKWYVEGDENTKFFHGMLNKKRSQLNIRGIMINGTWTDNPKAVKQEFFQHFRNRFDKPPDQNAHIDMLFPNSLSTDQQKDLECMVSKEEDYGLRKVGENMSDVHAWKEVIVKNQSFVELAIHGPEGGLITDVRRGFRLRGFIVQKVKELLNQVLMRLERHQNVYIHTKTEWITVLVTPFVGIREVVGKNFNQTNLSRLVSRLHLSSAVDRLDTCISKFDHE